MKLKTSIAVVVAGSCLLLLPLVFLSGWLKYLLMFVGSAMLRAVWECYAGVMPAESDQETSPCFKGFDETNYGDVMQNWRGLNGHSLGDHDL